MYINYAIIYVTLVFIILMLGAYILYYDVISYLDILQNKCLVKELIQLLIIILINDDIFVF